MILEALIAIGVGIVIGILTGLLPGIHINLVMVVLIPLILERLHTNPLAIAAGVVALAATHTLLDFIPSIYTGAPDEETALAILPAHKLLKEGKGHEAALITIAGSIAGLISLGITAPILITLLPLVEGKITGAIPFALIAISLFMIIREQKIAAALICFLGAGFLGYATLNLPIREPLFPLLGGLFGMSGLILSLQEKTQIPAQEKTTWKEMQLSKKDWRKTITETTLLGLPCSILPALGSGYAALIASEVSPHTPRRFLMLSSAMNIYVMGASFFIIFATKKARTGAAAAIETLLTNITLEQVIFLGGVFIAITLVAAYFSAKLSQLASSIIVRIPYRIVSLAAIIFITITVSIISGLPGLLVLATGTFWGMYALKSGVGRMHLMGCLLLPTILYYLI